MTKNWQTKWFASYSEADAFVTSIWNTSWGVELRKVNAGNKVYTSGYTVRWYAR